MNCNHLNCFIIWTLALFVIADAFILYAEIKKQRCDKIAEKESAAEIQEIKEAIKKLEKEINTDYKRTTK